MKTFVFVGGIIGLIIFLAVGLLPAIVYGGFAGVALAGAIYSTPLQAGLIVKGIILLGMVAGLLSTASIFTVLGAVFGAGVGACVRKVVTNENDCIERGI